MSSSDLYNIIVIGGGPVLQVVLLGLLVLAVAWAAIRVARFGPGNIVGMIRYDQRQKGKLRVGDQAPDVQLVAMDGKTTARLSEHLGGRPSILVFGSFTCSAFRGSIERLQVLYRQYGDRVRFITIYIKEAHPEGEWQRKPNVRHGIRYAQPRTTEDRVRIAGDFIQRFQYEPPIFVDPIDNQANAAYAAWPERLYVVDESGTIVYKGKPGPFGYHPEEVEAWLMRRFDDHS